MAIKNVCKASQHAQVFYNQWKPNTNSLLLLWKRCKKVDFRSVAVKIIKNKRNPVNGWGEKSSSIVRTSESISTKDNFFLIPVLSRREPATHHIMKLCKYVNWEMLEILNALYVNLLCIDNVDHLQILFLMLSNFKSILFPLKWPECLWFPDDFRENRR